MGRRGREIGGEERVGSIRCCAWNLSATIIYGLIFSLKSKKPIEKKWRLQKVFIIFEPNQTIRIGKSLINHYTDYNFLLTLKLRRTEQL